MAARSVFLTKLLAAKADREYEAALEAWHAHVDEARAQEALRLADPAHVAELGLPAGLGAQAVAILAHTQALDANASAMPTRRQFYIRHGLD